MRIRRGGNDPRKNGEDGGILRAGGGNVRGAGDIKGNEVGVYNEEVVLLREFDSVKWMAWCYF